MAEISILHFQEDDPDLFPEEISTVDPIPCWPDEPIPGPTPAQNATVSTDRKNQVNFVMDLLHQRVEEFHLMGPPEIVSNDVNDPSFEDVDVNYDVGPYPSDFELGFVDDYNNHNHVDYDDFDGINVGNDENYEEDDFNFGGFLVSDCGGDDFYIARRENCMCRCDGGCGDGVRVDNPLVSDSDSEGEEENDDGLLGIGVDLENEFRVNGDDDDDDDELSITLRWDSFHLEEEVVDDGEVNNDFEWEEVDDGVDEREVLSVVADPEDEEEEGMGSISLLNILGSEEDGVEERGRGFGNSDWEVLLNRNPEMENDAGPFGGDGDDYIYTAEYEMMFGQFADSENALSRPPTSKAVVEKLPSVVMTREDMLNEKALCAVCKDQIEVGEEGKQLPCTHHYHGDCILPWLGIRNTCPVCRHELPTDDPDYEQRRLRRAARNA